ncbi:LysR family transcriptional regulator [Azotobacter beijerinckii]|uniref:DNA-binding transcriptional regulator, LysR family n=1 Tax=Azotobacter beijerinckii TaxID=170623 RepID=A0A1I4I4Q5_9GAMM|nr:LysR family transcriptional regulator [Azotobacter beijerinckii]SFL49097.1 DNA-binding transcriptional regulator, LysR family [Azotobacter beijerinckii]
MDKLLALRMFIETVDASGFSAAARAIGVATSSVTRMVDALETELGTVLLNRSTRQISVTEAGAAYYERGRAILEAVAEADAQVADRGDQPIGLLRVCMPVAFGRCVVAPHLQRLLARHPGLEVDVTLSDEISNLLSERIDVSIRLGSTLHSDDIVSRTIGHFQRWLVVSPDYLRAHPTPLLPIDLLQHECLRFNYGTTRQNWSLRGGGEDLQLEIRGRLKSNNADLLREAALAGAGVALLADWLVGPDVSSGRLIRLLGQYEVNPGQAQTSINALYLPNHRGSTRVSAFIDFLQEVLASAT